MSSINKKALPFFNKEIQAGFNVLKKHRKQLWDIDDRIGKQNIILKIDNPEWNKKYEKKIKKLIKLHNHIADSKPPSSLNLLIKYISDIHAIDNYGVAYKFYKTLTSNEREIYKYLQSFESFDPRNKHDFEKVQFQAYNDLKQNF